MIILDFERSPPRVRDADPYGCCEALYHRPDEALLARLAEAAPGRVYVTSTPWTSGTGTSTRGPDHLMLSHVYRLTKHGRQLRKELPDLADLAIIQEVPQEASDGIDRRA